MAPTNRFPIQVFLLLTVVPAIVIGAGLWYLSSLIPSCAINEQARLTSPDSRFDLVTFSRDCGTSTGPNTQAALIPAGEALPDDAASFASFGVAADLGPRWDGFGNIELTLPQGGDVYRRDSSVADVDVIYR